MWREMRAGRRASRSRSTAIKVVAYSFGSGDETVFCLNGGPGLPCDYLREAHSCLVDQGYRVVAFDQLGTGASDRPDRPGALDHRPLCRGNRDGPQGARSRQGPYARPFLGRLARHRLCADLSGKSEDADPRGHRRRHAASDRGTGTAARGARARDGGDDAEARGARARSTIPEYQAAVTILNYRHVCRLPEWPAPVQPLARRLEHGTLQRPCRGPTSSSISAISRTGTACRTCRGSPCRC